MYKSQDKLEDKYIYYDLCKHILFDFPNTGLTAIKRWLNDNIKIVKSYKFQSSSFGNDLS